MARTMVTVTCCAVLLSGAMAQDAEEEKDKGWQDQAEFSFVKTSGNSNTSSLGLSNKTWRKWESSAVEINLGGVRADAANDRYAVRVPSGNIDVVVPDRELTAENYWLDGKYYQEIRKDFFWQAGGGWNRDTFAGVNSRLFVFGGVGNIWVDSDRQSWRTDYSLSYTVQDDVVDDPEFDDSYLGIQLTSNYKLNFGKSSSYGNDTAFNFNVDTTEDWRMVMSNWVAVTMTTHLALKVDLQWRYSNDPRLEELTLYQQQPDGSLLDTGQTFSEPLEKLDTTLTASLVVNF
jgi:putative salt-induced outer membrane protein YdiY